MKILKITSAIVLSSIISSASNSLAAEGNKDNYYANYYEDEGSLIFKIRGFYLNTSSKLSGFPASTSGQEKPKSLAQLGYGADAAVTYFFTDNIATELSLGVGILKVKSSILSNVATNLGDGTGNVGKNNQIIIVPVAGTVQYHIAPYGAIRPYVGGGLHGTYMNTRSKSIKVSSGFGPVLQVGVDFIAKDDTLITFDVRQYFLKSNVTFKKALLGPNNPNPNYNDMSSKAAWNPLVVSIGIGFKF